MHKVSPSIDLDEIVALIDATEQPFPESASSAKVPAQIILESPSKYLKELILRKDNRNVFGCKLVDRSGALSGAAVVEQSSWDTAHFGLGVGKMKVAFFKDNVAAEYRRAVFDRIKGMAPFHGIEVVFARVPLIDSFTIHSLEDSGAIMADTLLTFYIDLNGRSVLRGKGGCESQGLEFSQAWGRDEETLKSIAARVFHSDHFHSDPRLSKKKCDDLYVKWISNSLKGGADAVFVAKKKGKILGFISCKLHAKGSAGSTGAVDLVGVRSDCVGNGVGSFLVSKSLGWFSNHANIVTVGTHASNIPALRLYRKIGFKPFSSEATLHLWIT